MSSTESTPSSQICPRALKSDKKNQARRRRQVWICSRFEPQGSNHILSVSCPGQVIKFPSARPGHAAHMALYSQVLSQFLDQIWIAFAARFFGGRLFSYLTVSGTLQKLDFARLILDKFYLKSNANRWICIEVCTDNLKLNQFKCLCEPKPFVLILY